MQHELQILGVKLKEKDQEVKLNDLKIKELRKQVVPAKRFNDKESASSRRDQR